MKWLATTNDIKNLSKKKGCSLTAVLNEISNKDDEDSGSESGSSKENNYYYETKDQWESVIVDSIISGFPKEGETNTLYLKINHVDCYILLYQYGKIPKDCYVPESFENYIIGNPGDFYIISIKRIDGRYYWSISEKLRLFKEWQDPE